MSLIAVQQGLAGVREQVAGLRPDDFSALAAVDSALLALEGQVADLVDADQPVSEPVPAVSGKKLPVSADSVDDHGSDKPA